MKFKYLFFSAALLSPIPSFAEMPAPFGLNWGMDKGEIADLGVVLNQEEGSPGLEIYRTSELPHDLSNAELYSITIDNEEGLQRIRMVSDTVTNDAYGVDGKEAYSKIKSALTNKYGEASNEFEFTGGKVWKESDEFYQCLDYDGCGAWASFFKDKESEQIISLSLEGIGRGKGYILLVYEGPRWGDVVDRVNAEKAANDSSAL